MVMEALRRLAEEDPTFRVRSDENTGQTLIAGMGELHLEIVVDRLMREHKVAVHVGKPQVAFRETITRKSEAEGRYIRQTGGRGQFGDCHIVVSPTQEVEYEFVDKIVGGVIPREFIPSVEYGVRAIPTMILFKGGQVAETLVGMMPKAGLKAKLSRHIA